VDLTLQSPGDHLYIRAVSGQGIQIGELWYHSSLILSADCLIPEWALDHVQNCNAGLLEPIFELRPDVVLFGTGTRQHFLPAELMMEFYQRSVGVEVMATDAACRTFNVLVSEGRRVVAALVQSRANPQTQSMNGISA
jgi:uncharacterized protein